MKPESSTRFRVLINIADIQARNILVSVSVEDFDCFIRKFLEKTPPRYYGDEYGDLPGYAVASEKLPIPLLPRPDLFKFKFAGLGMCKLLPVHLMCAGFLNIS